MGGSWWFRSSARTRALAGTTVLIALVVVACGSPLGGSLGTQLRVATPRFSIEPGTHNEDILVEVATTTADATIYVTTDGTDPLVSGEPYGGPITVAGDGTETDIRAYALREGMQRSGVIRGVFEIAYEALPAPEFDPAGGTDSDPEVSGTALSVTLSVPGHTDADITYNIDGGPDQPYSGPIVLDTNGTFTISARATKAGYRDSAVASATYQMNLGVTAEPTFRLADGTEVLPDTYPYDLAVELATATPGATVYYTVADGTTAPAPEVGNPAHEYTGDAIQIAGDETEKTIRAVAKAPGLDVSATAAGTFILRWPRLTLDSVGIGSIEIDAFGTSGPEPVQHGTPVAITATSGTDYDFDRWTVVTGTAVIDDATAAQTSVTLTADATVQANFVDENAAAAPTVSGPSLTNDNTPTWTWTPGGGGNGTYRFKLNDGDLSVDATQVTATSYTADPALSDGDHTLYVQEEDDAGNWSATGSWSVTVDTQPPGPPAVSGTTPTSNPRPTWTWTSGSGDGNGTFRYKLNDSDLSTGSTETTVESFTPASDLATGTHALYVQERDDAGNWSVSGEHSIAVDTQPPGVPTQLDLTAASDSEITTDNITNITTGLVFTGESEPEVEIELSSDVDGVLANTVSDSSGVWTASVASPLSEGSHSVTAIATDALGNVSSPSSALSITIDTTAPPISDFTINSDAATPPDTQSLSVTLFPDLTSDAYQVRFRNAGGTWSSWAAEATSYAHTLSSSGGEGNKTVELAVKDRAGNISTDSETIEYDLLPSASSITLQDLTSGSNLTTDDIDVRIVTSGAQNVTQMRVRESGFTYGWRTYSSLITHRMRSTTGLKTLEVQYRDNQGNITSYWRSDSITYTPDFDLIDANEIAAANTSTGTRTLYDGSSFRTPPGSIILVETGAGTFAKLFVDGTEVNQSLGPTVSYDPVVYDASGNVTNSVTFGLFYSERYYNFDNNDVQEANEGGMDAHVWSNWDWLYLSPVNGAGVLVYYTP